MYYISDVLCKYRRGAREINEIDGCHQRKRLSKKLHGSFRKSVPSAGAMPRDLVPSSRSATVSAILYRSGRSEMDRAQQNGQELSSG